MPQIIGALIAALLTAARTYLPGIAGRVLLALGIGFATYEFAMPAILSLMQSQVSGLSPLLHAYFGALGIDMGITMILSAMAARAAHKAIMARVGSPS